MTLVAPEHQVRESVWAELLDIVATVGLDALESTINRAFGTDLVKNDPLLHGVIVTSIDAFLQCDGDPEYASARVASLLWDLGDRHARQGRDADTLAHYFHRALLAAQRGVKLSVSGRLNAEATHSLHRDVQSFVRRLHHHAKIGWDRAQVMLTMPSDIGRERLAATALGSNDASTLSMLAELAGIPLTAEYAFVVSADGALPATVLDHPEVLAANSLLEALVPADWGSEELASLLTAQTVIGPITALTTIAETAGLTRRAAELLRDGFAFDQRLIVPCTDLLASLVVDGNPELTGLIVTKHLARMNSLTPYRRLTTGELLLQWLERGLPLNKLARELEIPAQTAHDRMKTARKLFGDALEDPAQRLELTVALQAVLPRWRAEVSSTLAG